MRDDAIRESFKWKTEIRCPRHGTMRVFTNRDDAVRCHLCGHVPEIPAMEDHK